MANFGDSDGLPRDEVDHCGQIEDFRSAITFATTLPDIDAARIGIWGTSLGGRNVLAVAAVDRRITCVLSQVPLITATPEHWAQMVGGDVDVFLRALADDRRDRAFGKEPQYIHFPEDPTTDYGSHFATFGEEERRNWNKRVTLRSFEPTPIDDIMGPARTPLHPLHDWKDLRPVLGRPSRCRTPPLQQPGSPGHRRRHHQAY